MPPPFTIATSACAKSRSASAMRLPIAASRVRTVALRLSSSVVVVPSGTSSSRLNTCSKSPTTAGHFRIGCNRRGVDDAELRPPGHRAIAVLDLHVDRDIDDGDVLRVVARFDDRVAAVVVDEKIVVVPGQDQVDAACGHQLIVLPAVGMHHATTKSAPSRRSSSACSSGGADRRQEFQILGARRARRSIERRSR